MELDSDNTISSLISTIELVERHEPPFDVIKYLSTTDGYRSIIKSKDDRFLAELSQNVSNLIVRTLLYPDVRFDISNSISKLGSHVESFNQARHAAQIRYQSDSIYRGSLSKSEVLKEFLCCISELRSSFLNFDIEVERNDGIFNVYSHVNDVIVLRIYADINEGSVLQFRAESNFFNFDVLPVFNLKSRSYTNNQDDLIRMRRDMTSICTLFFSYSQKFIFMCNEI